MDNKKNLSVLLSFGVFKHSPPTTRCFRAEDTWLAFPAAHKWKRNDWESLESIDLRTKVSPRFQSVPWDDRGVKILLSWLNNVHQGKSRWHSYHVLVYISPVLTYLLGTVPCTLTMGYLDIFGRISRVRIQFLCWNLVVFDMFLIFCLFTTSSKQICSSKFINFPTPRFEEKPFSNFHKLLVKQTPCKPQAMILGKLHFIGIIDH